ncbi:uncharacterized protein LOC134203720 [Armigeres subalbatus]|uniref:uncharacterized protein LOC134203720 n=1 Tax=Armigeres subalbatus TaxID=124917 RepID=UPI002ED10540
MGLSRSGGTRGKVTLTILNYFMCNKDISANGSFCRVHLNQRPLDSFFKFTSENHANTYLKGLKCINIRFPLQVKISKQCSATALEDSAEPQEYECKDSGALMDTPSLEHNESGTINNLSTSFQLHWADVSCPLCYLWKCSATIRNKRTFTFFIYKTCSP